MNELAEQIKGLAGNSTADLIGFAPGDVFGEERMAGKCPTTRRA